MEALGGERCGQGPLDRGRAMEALRGERCRQGPLRTAARRRLRALSFLGAAAISAASTPACAFLTHQHPCHGAARAAPPSTNAAEKGWNIAQRSSSPRRVRHLPAHAEERGWQFKPLKLPPLVRSIPKSGCGRPEQNPGEEVSELSGDVPALTRSKPRGYQTELFRSVMECERNSLVCLPPGPGTTLVTSMVLKQLLGLNPGRQALFLVETAAVAARQVRI